MGSRQSGDIMMDLAVSNIRPGRSVLFYQIRYAANYFRTKLYFLLKAPWIKRSGAIRIPWNTNIWSPHKDISLGDRVQFGPGCIIHCDAHFGNNILVASNVAFYGKDAHRIDVIGKTIWDSPRGDNYKIIVEDDVWIGHGAIILSGLTIGRGAVVAAGAVVTKDVPRYSIAAGNPAQVIKMRFSESQIKQHEQILYQ
jgi:acetyltransferase-like isoleucine patch superfamily enzyme